MPDAIYLYTTGYWKDTARNERAGSIALDYVGKCFADGIPQCCLMVKFACHRNEFNDDEKWYIYPEITDDKDIWDILTYTFTGNTSIGKGYHHKVHPFLTTKFQKISPPMLRIYTNHEAWFVNSMYWTTEPAFSTYIRIRSFSDTTTDSVNYVHVNKSAQFQYIIIEGRLFRGINQYDPFIYPNKFISNCLSQNNPHIQDAVFSAITANSIDNTPDVEYLYDYVTKVTTIGKIYNSSMIFNYFYVPRGSTWRFAPGGNTDLFVNDIQKEKNGSHLIRMSD